MMPDEKARLLALFSDQSKWCRHAEACDESGMGVGYDDQSAVAWDITGALCQLFGWQRACVLFKQVDRHLVGPRKHTTWSMNDPIVESIQALQELNDRADFTFESLRESLEKMPIWNSGRRSEMATSSARRIPPPIRRAE